MTDTQGVLLALLVVFLAALTMWTLVPPPCQPQPVIHCLDGFYRYADTQNGIEHIYCLREKYEPPETP